MYVFAEPVTDEQIHKLQSRNDGKIENFERELLGLHPEDSEAEEWDEIRAKVQESMDRDEAGNDDVDMSETALDVEEEGQDSLEERVGEDEMEVRANHSSEAIEADSQPVSGKADLGEMAEAETALDEDTEAPSTANEAREESVDELEESSKESSTDMSSLAEEGEYLDNALQGVGGRTMSETLKSRGKRKTGGSDSASGGDTSYLDSLGAQASQPHDAPLLSLTLTIRNKVDGSYVYRPTVLTRNPGEKVRVEDYETLFGAGADNNNNNKNDNSNEPRRPNRWDVEYAIEEVANAERAWALYRACQARRARRMAREEDDEGGDLGAAELFKERVRKGHWHTRQMATLSRRGKRWRKSFEEERRESGEGVYVLGKEGVEAWEGAREGKEAGDGVGDRDGGGNGTGDGEDLRQE